MIVSHNLPQIHLAFSIRGTIFRRWCLEEKHVLFFLYHHQREDLWAHFDAEYIWDTIEMYSREVNICVQSKAILRAITDMNMNITVCGRDKTGEMKNTIVFFSGASRE